MRKRFLTISQSTKKSSLGKTTNNENNIYIQNQWCYAWNWPNIFPRRKQKADFQKLAQNFWLSLGIACETIYCH